MLIKTTLIAAIAAIGLTGAAMAGGSKAPTILDDQALDNITAGAKVEPYRANSPDEKEIGADLQKLGEALAVASVSTRNGTVLVGSFEDDIVGIEIYDGNDSVLYFSD